MKLLVALASSTSQEYIGLFTMPITKEWLSQMASLHYSLDQLTPLSGGWYLELKADCLDQNSLPPVFEYLFDYKLELNCTWDIVYMPASYQGNTLTNEVYVEILTCGEIRFISRFDDGEEVFSANILIADLKRMMDNVS